MHPALSAAITDQYLAFDRPAPTHVEGCDCCASPAELAALVAVPLRQLGHDQLGAYAANAIGTVGTVEDFRYFWPRMAELLITVQPGQFYVDSEILLGKLKAGRGESWPVPERQSVDRFLRALIERLRDDPLDAAEVDSWICAVGQATDDVVALLHPLLVDAPAARHNLRGFYEWNRRAAVKHGKLANAFWQSATGRGEPMNPNVGPIVEWLESAAVSTALGHYPSGGTATWMEY